QYWKGGNKNELVICLGGTPSNIKWLETFSWCKEISTEVKLKSWFLTKETKTLDKLLEILPSTLEYWKRREFSEFEYITVYLTTSQQFLVSVIVIILCSILIFYFVKTDIGS